RRPPVGAPPLPRPAAPAPPPPADPPPTRIYSAADVPFVGDFRRRQLESYATAEDAKAMAINVRGFVGIASRRIDFATARRIALEECTRVVEREVPNVRPFDRCMIYAIGNDVVWSFRPPPLPPPPYIPAKRPSPPILVDAATVPLLPELGRRNFAQHYMTSDKKRAFIMGRNHFEWWTPSETEADAIRRNLQICGHITGQTCMVYAVQEQVVVRVPERHRVVDVFTPQDLRGLDAHQQEAVERYLVADDWRAIAVGRNGRFGLVSGRASEDAAVKDAVSE